MELKLTALVVVCTLVGGVVGSWITGHLEKDTQFGQELMRSRIKAYTSWTTAQAQFMGAANDVEKREASLKIDTAQKSIGIVGSSQSVQAVSTFLQSFSGGRRDQQCKNNDASFVNAILRMRAEIGIDLTSQNKDTTFLSRVFDQNSKFVLSDASEPPAWSDLALVLVHCGKQ